jgi:hypothetical protein
MFIAETILSALRAESLPQRVIWRADSRTAWGLDPLARTHRLLSVETGDPEVRTHAAGQQA